LVAGATDQQTELAALETKAAILFYQQSHLLAGVRDHTLRLVEQEVRAVVDG